MKARTAVALLSSVGLGGFLLVASFEPSRPQGPLRYNTSFEPDRSDNLNEGAVVRLDERKLYLYNDFQRFESDKVIMMRFGHIPNLVSFPAAVKVYHYDALLRLNHLKHFLTSWSRAGNSKIMFIYDLKKNKKNLDGILGISNPTQNVIFYIAKKYQNADAFIGVPVVYFAKSEPKTEDKIEKKQIIQVFEAVLPWLYGPGTNSEFESEFYIVSDSYVESSDPSKVFVTGDDRWNVYRDAKRAVLIEKQSPK